MKRSYFLLFIILGVLLGGCEQKTSKIDKQTETVAVDKSENKFLITDNAVGHFKIGEAWQSTAKEDYKYKYVQGYGTCTDACCDGGSLLGNKTIDDEYGTTIENPQLNIGAMLFDEDESESKHKNNPDVFYVSSDNCKGWYWKDKTEYITIFSDLFKTKEGIGVGTTLEELQEKFGELHFYVGWIEEDVNALQVEIKAYPKIKFILDIEDYKDNWEDISLKGDENSITIANFKKGSKIKRLLFHKINENQ